MKYRSEYKYSSRFYPEHVWTVVGRHMGIHLHITDLGKESNPRYSGGIEYHWRVPPEHMENDAPSSDNCWLLKCPCWHDGSSMHVTDYWIPMWLEAPDKHERMFEMLQGTMEDRQPTTMELVSKVMGIKESEDEE